MIPHARVVAALLRRGASILVQKRPQGGARSLMWEFPGGKVEPGETDADALRRECREELGIDVAVGRVAARTRHAYADLEVELLLYECRRVAGEPQNLSAHELRWVAARRLAELPFCPADVPLLCALSTPTRVSGGVASATSVPAGAGRPRSGTRSARRRTTARRRQ